MMLGLEGCRRFAAENVVRQNAVVGQFDPRFLGADDIRQADIPRRVRYYYAAKASRVPPPIHIDLDAGGWFGETFEPSGELRTR